MTKDDFTSLIKTSLETQPERWVSFYRRFNVNPNTKQPIDDIFQACRQFGSSALKEVNSILQSEQVSGFNGMNLLNGLKDVILGKVVEEVVNDDSESEEDKEQREAEEQEQKEAEAKSERNKKIIIYGGAALVLIGVIVAIICLRK